MIPDFYNRLLSAGLPVVSATDDGAAIFSRTMTPGETDKYNMIVMPTSTMQALAQAHMDAVVSVRGYADILSACSYAGSANPTWAAEGAACAAWRDAVWARTFEIIDAGEPYPEPDVFVGMLPGMVWP